MLVPVVKWFRIGRTIDGPSQGLDGYMIEVAGNASSKDTKQLDQKLSADRAAATLSHGKDEHPDAQGRALNQRVDVKVLINKGLAEGV